MTKVLKLNVVYEGRYGGDVDETMLLPVDVNGVIFKELKDGEVLEDEISLGEIEGKHSECFGDLYVDIVDLDNLNIEEVSRLVSSSNYDELEGFFEEAEANTNPHDEEVVSLLDKYEVDNNAYILTREIHDNFIESLKENYVTNFNSIKVKEKDYEKVVELLKSNGIEFF